MLVLDDPPDLLYALQRDISTPLDVSLGIFLGGAHIEKHPSFGGTKVSYADIDILAFQKIRPSTVGFAKKSTEVLFFRFTNLQDSEGRSARVVCVGLYTQNNSLMLSREG